MSRLLLEKPFPGATTCVLVGDALSVDRSRLQPFRRLLWLTDRESARRARPILPRAAVETALVDDVPAVPILEQFLRHDPRHLPSVFVSDAVLNRHAEVYRRMLTDIHATLESHHRSRITRQKDGFTWQKHLFENLFDYVTHRVPASWAGALAGVPALVCGAGPSFDVSAPKLAPFADRAVVFASDSSLRALSRHGVQADFTVSVDAAKQPEKCLPAAPAPPRIVLSAVSPPRWQTALPLSQRFYLSSSQVTIDWLATQGIARTPLSVTENCGATALELARFLGCAPIYLFGLDFAADANNPHKRHHADADASLYTHSGYDPAQTLPCVPGNYVDELPSFAFIDWQTVDARLAGWPADLVFNVNDRGARLRNTTVVHPDHFRFQNGDTAKSDALAALGAPQTVPGAVLQAAQNRIRLAATLGRVKASEMREHLADGNYDAIAERLRQIFKDQAFARVFGAFSLKAMPHLVPPIENDPALWHTLLDELDQLAAIAAR